jgi:hypothetical protein
MHRETVEKFEEAVRSVLGEIRIGQNTDVSGTAIAPEHEADLSRVSAALLPLLQELARIKHLWVLDRNFQVSERPASPKMYLNDSRDIVLVS